MVITILHTKVKQKSQQDIYSFDNIEILEISIFVDPQFLLIFTCYQGTQWVSHKFGQKIYIFLIFSAIGVALD